MEHSVKINVESDEEGFGYVQVGIEFEQEEEKQMDEEVKHSEEGGDVNLYDASYFVGDRLIYDGKRVCSYILSLKNMSDVSKNKLRMFKSLLY